MVHRDKELARIRSNYKNVCFDDLVRICTREFGPPRVHGSHYVFNTPWKGDPRVNIQNRGGNVAPYQVKQVLKALERKEAEDV